MRYTKVLYLVYLNLTLLHRVCRTTHSGCTGSNRVKSNTSFQLIPSRISTAQNSRKLISTPKCPELGPIWNCRSSDTSCLRLIYHVGLIHFYLVFIRTYKVPQKYLFLTIKFTCNLRKGVSSRWLKVIQILNTVLSKF